VDAYVENQIIPHSNKNHTWKSLKTQEMTSIHNITYIFKLQNNV